MVKECLSHSYFCLKWWVTEAASFWRTISRFFFSVGDTVFCMFFGPIFNSGVSVLLAELQITPVFVLILSSKTGSSCASAQCSLPGWCSKYSALCSLVMLRCSGLFAIHSAVPSVPARCANPDICWLMFWEWRMVTCTYTMKGTLLSKLVNSHINAMPSEKLTSYLPDIPF